MGESLADLKGYMDRGKKLSSKSLKLINKFLIILLVGIILFYAITSALAIAGIGAFIKNVQISDETIYSETDEYFTMSFNVSLDNSAPYSSDFRNIELNIKIIDSKGNILISGGIEPFDIEEGELVTKQLVLKTLKTEINDTIENYLDNTDYLKFVFELDFGYSYLNPYMKITLEMDEGGIQFE